MRQSAIFLMALPILVGLVFSGCGQSQQETQGEPAIVKASIVADCIVHYYKTNTSAYITQQKHGYNPSKGFFEATSNEPDGKIQCTLLKEKYTSSNLKKNQLSDLPSSFWSKNLAIAAFYSFCAGGDLLETESMNSSDNIKVESQWYKALKPQWPGDIEVTLLRSLESKRIELVRLEDEKTGLVWLLRCYNFLYRNSLNKSLPRTIDVFDIRNGIASKELMIRFDYKNIQKVE